jgi:hypothetical protein
MADLQSMREGLLEAANGFAPYETAFLKALRQGVVDGRLNRVGLALQVEEWDHLFSEDTVQPLRLQGVVLITLFCLYVRVHGRATSPTC